MDSVHAFPPHNVSNRLSYVESFVIFCIYGGLRRQNKQAAINGSHKKTTRRRSRALQESGPQGNSTSFLSFIRRKAKNPKRQAVFRRAAHASAAGTPRRSSRGLPEIPPPLIHTAQAPDHRACVGKPNAPAPAPVRAESRFAHRRRREGRGRKHTRFRPSDAAAGKSVFRHRACPYCAAALRPPERRRRRAAAVSPA